MFCSKPWTDDMISVYGRISRPPGEDERATVDITCLGMQSTDLPQRVSRMTWLCLAGIAFAAFIIGAIAAFGLMAKVVGLPPW